MKRVIKASRIDDIKKARDEYEEAYAKRKAQHDEEHAKYVQAREAVFEPVRKYIENMIASPILDFEVRVESSDYYGERRGLSVRVDCNQQRVHDETSALSWNFSVKLDKDANIIKDSGSWSGLSATTAEQMASLKASVEVLEILNNIDWANLLDKALPKWDEYITVSDSRRDRPNFEAQLKEAELEEAINSRKPIAGKGLDSFGYYERADVWYLIVGETPKQYKAACFTDYTYQAYVVNGDMTHEEFMQREESYAQRVKKENLIASIKMPIQYFEPEA